MDIVTLAAARKYADTKFLGFVPQGDYNVTTEYKYGDWVNANGGSYGYIYPTPSTGVPVTDTSHWQQIAEKGDTGASAYQAAVSAGYQGTEAEFEQAMADLPAATEAANFAGQTVGGRMGALENAVSMLPTFSATIMEEGDFVFPIDNFSAGPIIVIVEGNDPNGLGEMVSAQTMTVLDKDGGNETAIDIPSLAGVGALGDTYNVGTGVLSKRVSSQFILDETSGWGFFNSSSTNTYRMAALNWSVGKNVLQGVAGAGIGICDDGDFHVLAQEKDSPGIIFSSDSLVLRILKSKIDAMPSGGTSDGFKEYLALHNINLRYIYAVPEVESFTPNIFTGYPGGSVTFSPKTLPSAVPRVSYQHQIDLMDKLKTRTLLAWNSSPFEYATLSNSGTSDLMTLIGVYNRDDNSPLNVKFIAVNRTTNSLHQRTSIYENWGNSKGTPTNVGALNCYKAIEFKGYIYLIAKSNADGLTHIYRAPKTESKDASYSWSEALWTGQTGCNISLPTSFNSDDNYLYVGEYGNPVLGPAVYRSSDGVTWTKIIEEKITYRHVHAITPDPFNPGHVWLEYGESQANQLWYSKNYGDTWEIVVKPSGFQVVQISFDHNYIWLASDNSNATVYAIDRKTLTPYIATPNSHKMIASPSGKQYYRNAFYGSVDPLTGAYYCISNDVSVGGDTAGIFFTPGIGEPLQAIVDIGLLGLGDGHHEVFIVGGWVFVGNYRSRAAKVSRVSV